MKEILEKILHTDFIKPSWQNPDPILIASKTKDEIISLVCALFAYGNAKMIVKFLDSIDFEVLKESEKEIKNYINHYYRFQNVEDVKQFFITLKRLSGYSLENIFLEGYNKDNFVIDGINELIKTIYSLNHYTSKGYKFLISNPYKGTPKGSSPYKRWNMYVRWMVRDSGIDFGLWKKVKKSDLIIPLDTHTFNVSQKIGLLERKTYDLYSAILLTNKLKEFDANDPVKYDFALYRIGQNKIETFNKKSQLQHSSKTT